MLRGASITEHVLLSDEDHQVQLELHGGTVLDGPVRLHYDLSGSIGLAPKLAALQRLLALQHLGHIPHTLDRVSHRVNRWTLVLRALDAHLAGAHQREIATAFWGEALVTKEWRGRSDYLRARVRRLVELGCAVTGGEYRRFLIDRSV